MPDPFPWRWLGAPPEPGSLRYPRSVRRGKVPVRPYKTGHMGVESRRSLAISNQALKFELRPHQHEMDSCDCRRNCPNEPFADCFGPGMLQRSLRANAFHSYFDAVAESGSGPGEALQNLEGHSESDLGSRPIGVDSELHGSAVA